MNYLLNEYIAPISFTDSFQIISCHSMSIFNGLILKLCQLDNKGVFNVNCKFVNTFEIYSEPMRIDSIIHINTYCVHTKYIGFPYSTNE